MGVAVLVPRGSDVQMLVWSVPPLGAGYLESCPLKGVTGDPLSFLLHGHSILATSGALVGSPWY